MIGLDAETLDLMLGSLKEFVEAGLPAELRLELDHEDVCPERLVRSMCGDDLGVQLDFIPERYGGMGGGTFDSYRVCEALAFAELASFLVPQSHPATIENVEFLAPVKFHRDEPRTLTVTALVRPDGADLAADCTLSADQPLPGSDEPQRKLHFTGSMRFGPAEPEPLKADLPERRQGRLSCRTGRDRGDGRRGRPAAAGLRRHRA